MYYILLKSEDIRNKFISYMKDNNINCVSHYQPLHNSSMYLNKFVDDVTLKPNLPITVKVAENLVRLPLWIGIDNVQDFIIDKLIKFFE